MQTTGTPNMSNLFLRRRVPLTGVLAGLVLALAWHAGGEIKAAGNRSQVGTSRRRPQTVAPWARRSAGSRHKGYYVGGGAALGGDPRDTKREGTWGWDYAPRWTRVRLRWLHGRRMQGGGGEYRSDGKTGLTGLPRLKLFR